MLKSDRLINASLLFFLLLFAVLYVYEYQLRLLPSIVDHGITQAYHLSSVSYGYVCAGYYLIYIPLQLVAGVVVDRYPLKKIMSFALSCAALGCWLLGNAHFFAWAIVGRIMMGVGAAFIFISIVKSITLRVSERYFTAFLGMTLLWGVLGILLMDMVMMWLLGHVGWRLVCYGLSFFGILLILLSYRSSSVPIGLTKSASYTLVSIKKYFCDRNVLIRSIMIALLYTPCVCLGESWGLRFLHSKVDVDMIFLGFGMGAPLLGYLYDKTGEYQLPLMLGSVGTTILLSIVLYVPNLSTLQTGVALFLLGLFSASVVVIWGLNRKGYPSNHIGTIFGVAHFFSMLVSASVVCFIGWAVDFSSAHQLTHYFALYAISDYQLAFLLLPCGTLCCVFLTFYVRDVH